MSAEESQRVYYSFRDQPFDAAMSLEAIQAAGSLKFPANKLSDGMGWLAGYSTARSKFHWMTLEARYASDLLALTEELGKDMVKVKVTEHVVNFLEAAKVFTDWDQTSGLVFSVVASSEEWQEFRRICGALERVISDYLSC